MEPTRSWGGVRGGRAAGWPGAALLAGASACGGAPPPAVVSPGDSGLADSGGGPLPSDPRVAFGPARPCDAPLPDAGWAEASAEWAQAYTVEAPAQHTSVNPGAMALLGEGADAVLAWVEPEGVALRRLRDGRTRRISGGAGLGGGIAALAVGDLDADGRADLLLAGGTVSVDWAAADFDAAHPAPAALHPARAGATTTDVAVGDLDGDGDADLVVGWSAAAPDDRAQMRATVLRNDGGGAFAEAEIAADPSVWGPAFDFSLRDVDGDGHLDAYLCNDKGYEYAPNRLFQGDGAGGLQARSGDGLDVRYSCMGTSWGDVDADGVLDLYLAEGAQHVVLREGAGGVWYLAAAALGLGAPFTDGIMAWGSTLLDFDNDGRMELVVANGDFWVRGARPRTPWWYEAGEDGVYAEIGASRGLPREAHSRGVIGADLNQDGVLDLLLSDAVRTPRVFLSTGCTADHWLEVEAAPGSEVLVEAGGRRYAARVDSESGWGSAGPAVAHIGLGSAARVDRLTVRAPEHDGAVVVEGFAARRRVAIRP